MTSLTRIAAWLTGLACFALVALLLAEREVAAAAAKVVASSGFLLAAVCNGAIQSRYGRIILAGLLLSFAGDIFLIGETPDAFLAGLAAFLLAHVAYVAAFAARGVSVRWMAAAAAPVLLVSAFALLWLLPQTPGRLQLPVFAYTLVISAMVIAAFGTRGRQAPALILAAALLFFISDLSVAALRLADVAYPVYVVGLPLYYAAQLCFAASTAQSRSH